MTSLSRGAASYVLCVHRGSMAAASRQCVFGGNQSARIEKRIVELQSLKQHCDGLLSGKKRPLRKGCLKKISIDAHLHKLLDRPLVSHAAGYLAFPWKEAIVSTVHVEEPLHLCARVTRRGLAADGVIHSFSQLDALRNALIAFFACVIDVVQQTKRVPQNLLPFLHNRPDRPCIKIKNKWKS